MDSITQAALGGVVGELVLGRKIGGGKGMLWGILFGTFPDLDVFLKFGREGIELLRWHRGISHSLLFIVLIPLLLAKPLSFLHRKRGLSSSRAAWFIFLAWGTHVLIDVFTGYGTQIFEPFSDQRVSMNNIAIVDPLFTLPLLFCLLWWPLRGLHHLIKILAWKISESDPEERPHFPTFKKRRTTIALTLSSLYVIFSLIMKLWAYDRISTQMEAQVPKGELVAVSPTLFNTLLWRALIETEKGYFITYWSPFDKNEDKTKFEFIAKNHQLAKKFQGEEDFKTLKWFSRGHWVARQDQNQSVIFTDIRFGELRDPKKQSMIPIFNWSLDYDQDEKLISKRVSKPRPSTQDALNSLFKRVIGEKDDWERVKTY